MPSNSPISGVPVSGTPAILPSEASDVQAPAPSVDGSGFIHGGEGDITAPAPSVDGTGAETIAGAGDITAPAPSIDGTGDVTVPGVITQHVREILRLKQAETVMSTHVREILRRRVPPEVTLSNDSDVDLIWVEITLANGDVVTAAEVDLPDLLHYYNGKKPGTLTGVDELDRGLSDLSGEHQIPKFSFTISDHDGAWRARLADPDTQYFAGMEIVARVITDRGRRIEDVPRTFFRGVVRKHKLLPDMQIRFECEDWLSSLFAANNTQAQIPKRRITTADFPNANTRKVESSAQSYVTNGVTALGQTHVLIRAGWGQFAPGDRIQFAGHLTQYGVSAASVTDPETFIDLDTALTAGVVDGEAITQTAVHDVVPAVNLPVPFGYGEITDMKPAGPDDAGDGQAKMIYVGEKVLADGKRYGEWMLYGHACYAPNGRPFQQLYFWNNPLAGAGTVYQNNVAVALQDLEDEADVGGRIKLPGYGGWGEVGLTDAFVSYGPGRHYTVLYMRGIFRDWALGIQPAPQFLGGIPFGVNAYGADTAGDGTGDHIVDLADQYLYCLRDYIIGDYQGGDHLDSPTFPDDTTLLKIEEDSFHQVNIMARRRVATGAPGNFAIGMRGETWSPASLIAQFNTNLDCDSGYNRKIQFALFMLNDDPATVMDGAQTLDDINDVLDEGDQFDVDDQDDRLGNIIRYVHTEDYFQRQSTGWRSADTGDVEVPASGSSASITRRGKVYWPETIEFHMIRGKNRASDPDQYQAGTDWVANVMAHRLTRTEEPPRVFTIPTGMRGFNFEVGEYIYVLTFKNIARVPWPARITRVKPRPGAESSARMVTIEAEDIKRILGL